MGFVFIVQLVRLPLEWTVIRMNDFLTKVDKTLRYHLGQLARGVRGAVWDVRKPLATRPVFVVGCSRAGTTLVYKTLSETRQLHSLQRETHDLWAELHPLAERDWATHAVPPEQACQRDREIISREFYRQTGALEFVDKNNQNGLNVAYLHRLFPQAHFVYVKRNPGDNIHSLIEGWGKADEFATWSNELPYDVAVDHNRYRQWCFFLAEGWKALTHSSLEVVCAFQYRTMNEAILADKTLIPQSQWSEVQYETLVNDPVAGFGRLFDSIGLPFDRHMEAHCREVLSTPYNAFSEIRLDKWRGSHNAERIEQVLPEVTTVAQAMGYEFP